MTSARGARRAGMATAGERFRRLLLRLGPAAPVAFVLLTIIFSIGSLIFLITDTSVSVLVAIPPEVKAVVVGPILPLGFQMSVLWFLLILAAATVLLLPTPLENWVQALGQNRLAARNLGVPWTARRRSQAAPRRNRGRARTASVH